MWLTYQANYERANDHTLHMSKFFYEDVDDFNFNFIHRNIFYQ